MVALTRIARWKLGISKVDIDSGLHSLMNHAQMKPGRLLIALLLVTSAVACSKTEEPAVVTLPENAPTTTVPMTLAPGGPDETQEPPEPPALEWVVQVGGAGEDTFNGVTSILRNADDPQGEQSIVEQIVAAGSTTGGLTGPTKGAEDVLSSRIATDGTVQENSVTGSTGPDVATSVASVFTSGAAADSPLSAALGCGWSSGDFAGSPMGLIDGWCGPLGNTSSDPGSDDDGLNTLLGFTITPFAAESNEVISGVAATGPDDSATLAAEQNIFLAGSTDGLYPGAGDSTGRGLGQGDALAFRTSLTRGTSWIRQFGTPRADAAVAVCTVDGNGYFAGWTDGDLGSQTKGGRDAWISMIDRTGMQRWLIQFGYPANEEFRAIATGGDPADGTQQFVAVGVTDGDGPSPSKGAKDALVGAFAPDGSLMWALQLGGQLDDDASAVAVRDTTIYVAGTTTSADAVGETPAISGFGDLDDSIGPGGSKDIFLSAIDAPTGSVLWTTRVGSAADEVVSSMTISETGILAIAGSTTGSLGQNTSAGGRDGFVIAYQLPSAGGGAQSWV